MTVVTKVLIWTFFLLIVNQTLVIMGFKFGLPVKPSIVYAVVAVGLFGLALMESQWHQRLMAAKEGVRKNV